MTDASDAGDNLSSTRGLLEEVKGLISERPKIVVHSKLDLHDSESLEGKVAVSSITGEGIEELRKTLVEMIAADEVVDPLNLPEDWPRSDLD